MSNGERTSYIINERNRTWNYTVCALWLIFCRAIPTVIALERHNYKDSARERGFAA